MTLKKKVALGVLAILVLGCGVAYLVTRPEPADARYTGAYALEDGRLMFIAPREGRVLRYRLMDGESGVLWPVQAGVYEGGAGWDDREPILNRARFEVDEAGRASALEWQRTGEEPRQARKLELPERIVTFPSGELALRGKLVTAAGEGPYPVVVIVHGSESYSAVDYYFQPYLFAAHGIATLAFDKRGTGASEGQFSQNFHVLSDDVVAAVRWLREQPEIDPRRVHLAGYSQGGWIAPLAALKDGAIASVLVGFGVMVPVTGEDRWGYVYALQQKGFGQEAIAAADRINALLEEILDRRIDRWSELRRALDAARAEPWFEAVRGSDSALGIATGSRMPLWAWRLLLWTGSFQDPPFIDRLYDPVPTLQRLDVPSLWLLAGEDSSAPAEWTVAELERLEQAGRPVEYHVFPEAEHGILRFTEDADGERRYLGYEPDFFSRQVAWLRERSAL